MTAGPPGPPGARGPGGPLGPTGSAPPAAPDASAPGPGESWTILRLILWSAKYLEGKGVPDARLDAEHLLAHALGTDRLRLYLDFERPLDPEELASFKPLLLRRAGREPLQYVLGHAPFRELDLRTDPRVLIPRPETEVLVGEVLEWAARGGREGLTAADLGTGSGAIGLSLAVEGPFARVVLSDVEPGALEVARENLARAAEDRPGLEGRVEVREGDLLEPLAGERLDVVVSNPPYVAEEDAPELQPEVRDFEPVRALLAADGGTAVLDRIVRGAADHLEPGGLLALEVGEGQARSVAGRIRETGRYGEPRIRRDLQGRERIVLAPAAGGA